jgi:hypothetical protein
MWMLVSSGALVILTAGSDPWTWMVLATVGVTLTWLALTYVGAWVQRARTWLRGRPPESRVSTPDSAPEGSGRDDATGSGLPRTG